MTTNGGFHFQSTYTSLPEKFYSHVDIQQVCHPKIILWNEQLAEELGLENDYFKKHGASILSGKVIPKNGKPIAQAYAGHQFGNFTNLGDGRAVLLGEHHTSTGVKVDIQLKGAGKTPYSRGGDGRAALGPMLREYIISEAMHAIGIPTTRALAVTTTGEKVLRESLLDGAILTRVAASHLRVGTFEYAFHFGTDTDLMTLVEYTIQSLYPELLNAENKALKLLETVIKKQASLIAKWQSVGFVHGVMNTDNMTMSGETIDYGPCAFIDQYKLNTVFSSIDLHGRYAFGNQPRIGEWNLSRFAETLLPILHDDEKEAERLAIEALYRYREHYEAEWFAQLHLKLGMEKETPETRKLILQLLALMEQYEADYTNTFLSLIGQQYDQESLFQSEQFKKWDILWKQQIHFEKNEKQIIKRMKNANVAIIPRNYFVEEAIQAAVEDSDMTKVYDLLHALKSPYAHSKTVGKYQVVAKMTKPYQTFCGT